MDEKVLSIVLQARDEASKVIGDVTGSIQASGKEAEDSGGKFKAAGAAVAAVGAGVALYANNAKDATVAWAGSVMQLSRETGIGTEKSSELIYAAQRMGLSADQASTTFGIFSKRISESASNTDANAIAMQKLQVQMQGTQKDIATTTDSINKNGDASGDLHQKLDELNIKLREEQEAMKGVGTPLQQLGINVLDASGKTKDFNQILLETADKFKAMPDGAEKTAAAMQLFGRSGKDLLPMLNQGADGIQKLEDRAKELGLTLTGDNLQKVKDYIKAQKDLKDSNQELQLTIGEKVLPVQTELTKKTNDLVQALLKAPEPIRGITTGLIAFGGPAATAAGGAVAFGANVATMIPILSKAKGEMTAFQFAAKGGIVLSLAVIGLDIWSKNIENAKKLLADMKKEEDNVNATHKDFVDNTNKASQAAQNLADRGLHSQADAMAKNVVESQKSRDEYELQVASYQGMVGKIQMFSDGLSGKVGIMSLNVRDNVDLMRESYYDSIIQMYLWGQHYGQAIADSIVLPMNGVANRVEVALSGVAGAVARALQPAITAAQIQGAAAGSAFQNAFNSQAGNLGTGNIQGAGGGLQGFSGGYIAGYAVGGFVNNLSAVAQGRDRRMAAIAPGEYVVTPEQQTNFEQFMNMLRSGVPQAGGDNGGGQGNVSITIQAGTILATNDEVRAFAERIYTAFRDIARRNGKLDNLPNIGVVPA